MEKMEQKKARVREGGERGSGRGREGEKAENPLEHALHCGYHCGSAVVWLIQREFGNVFRTIANLTPGFLTLGVVVSLVYFLFRGGRFFRLLLHSQGYHISVLEGLKNALLGLYYSYITPSSTGGQPMQSAYLLRDKKIPVGISTAALIIKFMCFQCAFVLVSAVSFAGMYAKLAVENPVSSRL